MDTGFRARLSRGLLVPEQPLALTDDRRLDERRQRALVRYHVASGAGGIAVGSEAAMPGVRVAGLLEPVWCLTRDELARAAADRPEPIVCIAAVEGDAAKAVAEAERARELGFDAVLLHVHPTLGGGEDAAERCGAVGDVLPVVASVSAGGGSTYAACRRLAEVNDLAAVRVGSCGRSETIAAVRAIAESGRDDVALYGGNADQLLIDLITPFQFDADGIQVERRITGAMLPEASCSTRRAAELLKRCHALSRSVAVPDEMLRLAVEVSDAYAAVSDARNGFAGRAVGVHAVLRRQGLMSGAAAVGPAAAPSAEHSAEIERVWRAYPHLHDDAFIEQHRDAWLSA